MCERERVCVRVCVCVRESVCESMRLCVRERERESVRACVCVREGREVGLFSSSAGGRGRSSLITADGSLVVYLHVKGNAHIVYALTGAIISVL